MIEKFLTNNTEVIQFSSKQENASEQYQKEFIFHVLVTCFFCKSNEKEMHKNAAF